MYIIWGFNGCEACEILAPNQGLNLHLHALGGGVLTTGSPGKSPLVLNYRKHHI